MKTFYIVRLQCYLIQKSERKLWHGVVTLVWINMFPGAYQLGDSLVKHEEFCKPQANQVQLRCDLLTSFHQGSGSVDEWYNAVQAQVSLTKYQQETVVLTLRSSLQVRSGSLQNRGSIQNNCEAHQAGSK